MEINGRTLDSPARFPNAKQAALYGRAQQLLNPVGLRQVAPAITASSTQEVRSHDRQDVDPDHLRPIRTRPKM
jgi:hypothetical protein